MSLFYSAHLVDHNSGACQKNSFVILRRKGWKIREMNIKIIIIFSAKMHQHRAFPMTHEWMTESIFSSNHCESLETMKAPSWTSNLSTNSSILIDFWFDGVGVGACSNILKEKRLFLFQETMRLSPGQTVLQLKPTQAKFTTSMELGIVWPPTWLELARVGLNLIKVKFPPNSSQVFSTVCALQSIQANSRQVVLLL